MEPGLSGDREVIADGERPTTRGGHVAPFSAVTEYPSFTTPDVTPENVLADLTAAAAIVDTCENVLDEMSPF